MLQRPNIYHPFFAYGTFKPGEIAYSRIEGFVQSATPAECRHKMLLRDGAPFISRNPGKHDMTSGYLIRFENDKKWEAYDAICRVASDKLYYWEIIDVGGITANALIGRKPSKSHPIEMKHPFEGGEDPFFNEAIDVVCEGLKEYKQDLKESKNDEDRLRSYFRLLRNYILLWASIERYISLRYGKGNEVKASELFARETVFQESLKRNVGNKKRDVYRTDNLVKITLDADCPEDAIDYYYTIRCNIVHRGKTPHTNDELVYTSLKELLAIFQDVLDDTFKKSKDRYNQECF